MTDVSTTAASPTATEGPKGIGGWLVLPVIGTVVSPFLMTFWTWQSVAALSAPIGTSLLVFVAIEALFNLALLIGWIVANVLLFKHKRAYPKFLVALLVVTLLGTVIDIFVGKLFDLAIEAEDIRGLVRSVIGLAIWGPYMFKSKRVRNTFVVD